MISSFAEAKEGRGIAKTGEAMKDKTTTRAAKACMMFVSFDEFRDL